MSQESLVHEADQSTGIETPRGEDMKRDTDDTLRREARDRADGAVERTRRPQTAKCDHANF